MVACLSLFASPALAGEYDNAFKGVTDYDVLFDVSQGNPKIANLIFWAVKNAYEVDEEWGEVVKFQDTLRQMKKDGVKLEVCLYAAKVLGVDKKTIIPEVDQVGNGFVSIAGYQMQGYGVVRIP